LNRRPQPRKLSFVEKEAEIDWNLFKEYLKQRLEARTAQRRFRYAEKFYGCLLRGDLSELQLLSDYKRAHVMRALSALAKFLGVYDYYIGLVRNYGLKWSPSIPDSLVLKRLTKVVDSGDMARWVQRFKRAFPLFSPLIDLMAASGLRVEESIEVNNTIISLAKKGRLRYYYNFERQALEHFRFKEKFIRRSKKAFISFVPEDVVLAVAEKSVITNRNTIQLRLKRRKIPARMSDLREYYASFMTKYLRESEIDFLQGRISASIFMRNYFNPAWISDLKSRALDGAKQLLITLNKP